MFGFDILSFAVHDLLLLGLNQDKVAQPSLSIPGA
jgi:hypothetical protein